MYLRNSSTLDTLRLESLFRPHLAGWPHEHLLVAVRHSRSAPFSGACYYQKARIYINVARSVRFPYRLLTHVAPARSTRRSWRREIFAVELPDAYRLALFLFLHEFYHWLVYRAGRNPRQKEGRCDRFAVRALVDGHRLVVTDSAGAAVPRERWDFQDLDGFVRRARQAPAIVPPLPVEPAARHV